MATNQARCDLLFLSLYFVAGARASAIDLVADDLKSVVRRTGRFITNKKLPFVCHMVDPGRKGRQRRYKRRETAREQARDGKCRSFWSRSFLDHFACTLRPQSGFSFEGQTTNRKQEYEKTTNKNRITRFFPNR